MKSGRLAVGVKFIISGGTLPCDLLQRIEKQLPRPLHYGSVEAPVDKSHNTVNLHTGTTEHIDDEQDVVVVHT